MFVLHPPEDQMADKDRGGRSRCKVCDKWLKHKGAVPRFRRD